MIPTFIACGGRGTRLGEQTKERQKCAIEYAGKPLLEHTLDWLEKHGIPKPGLIASYRSEDLVPLSPRVRNFIYEPKPMGTAGCLHAIKPLLDYASIDNFLYLFGDVYFDFDVGHWVRFYKNYYTSPHLALVRVTDHPFDSTLVPGNEHLNLAYCGAFILTRSIIDLIPADSPSDLTKDIFPWLREDELGTYEIQCPPAFVRDTGTPEGQEKVRTYLEQKAAVQEVAQP